MKSKGRKKKTIGLIFRPRVLTWNGLEWEKKQEDWLCPVEGIITSFWGERENPVTGKWELHNGLDIAAAEGTEVLAVKSGEVTEVRTSATYGKLLQYETEDGYTVMYAHLSKVLVKKGEQIRQGQVVAKSGNTGLSTGPHLHYSIWRNGELLDPLQFFAAEDMI